VPDRGRIDPIRQRRQFEQRFVPVPRGARCRDQERP
jgi:hypothetical protein